MIDLAKLKPEIERICRLLPVKRLGLYGSALTQSFSPSSDVDILVVFDSDENIDLFEKYFELKEQLEGIFNREIDLVVDKPFRNPIFRKSVEKTRTVIYER
ncbi:MAG: nucleotidyltransferase domain-containing protein [Thermodesulfovibrionales bacterium]|nr:nucleotidyltransferase domain-containing protein [Nitrospinota bacterium]MCG2710293.1 nucleotidyltransferase domain-containing protein [Thermodesulfovibrionales bacterium]